MSAESAIVDAVIADLTAAISGLTTSREPVQPDTMSDDKFPLAVVLQTEYDVEPLDWMQENRIWTISVALWQAGGTRDTMETKLEAIRAKFFADPTLDNSVDRALCVTSVPDSHPDDSRVAGLIVVRAERVY